MALFESTLTLLHHKTKNRIEVHRQYGQLPKVECYPNQLNQVFMNVLVNAVQAIDGAGSVFIRTTARANEVCIEICDSGPGIAERHLQRIFDPGFTTKGVGVGTGLGLSIVHQIVADHGGRIEVESQPPNGATFRILVPVRLPVRSSRPPLGGDVARA